MKTIIQRLLSELTRIPGLVLLMVFFTQCKGPEGPMGPAGYDGRDGIDGDAFAYSAIYDVDPPIWEGNADGYRVLLEVPEITEDIYYNGAVLVYRLIETEPKSFNMLPYTYVDNGLTIYMDFDAYVGGIDIYYKEIFEGTNDTFAPESFMAFKVVIIEGIPLATLKMMTDISDYNAVVRLFNMDNDSNTEIRIY